MLESILQRFLYRHSNETSVDPLQQQQQQMDSTAFEEKEDEWVLLGTRNEMMSSAAKTTKERSYADVVAGRSPSGKVSRS